MSDPTETWAARATESASRMANASLIANGGGAVAVLTFIGGLIGPDLTEEGRKFVGAAQSALKLFGLGVFASLVIHVCIYWANRLDFEARVGTPKNRATTIVYIIGYIALAAALSTFFFGIIQVSQLEVSP